MKVDPHAEYRDDPEYMALVGKLQASRMVCLGGSDFSALLGKLELIVEHAEAQSKNLEGSTSLIGPAASTAFSVDAEIASECLRILRHAENPDYTAGEDDTEQARRQA